MDLHRLRVVGFDTSVIEKDHEKNKNGQLEKYKKEDRKTSKVGNGDQIGDENQSLYDKSRPPESPIKYVEEISHKGVSKNCLGDTSDVLETSIKNHVNDEVTPQRTSKQYLTDTMSTNHLGTSKNQMTKSEISKIPPRKNPSKRALKVNSNDIGLTKLFQNSAYSQKKKRMINLPNRKKSARVHHKEENIKAKSLDVHFLFARETRSFIRYRRKRTANERTKKTHDSKFTNVIHGFEKSNRSMDRFQTSFLNFIDVDKLPFKKMRVKFGRKPKPPSPVTNCYCKHHAMRVLNSACGNVGSRPIYYNLGTHPHPRRSHQERDSDQEGFKRDRSHCMAKDKTVEVSPSLFSPECKSLRDAGTGPSKVELYAGSYDRQPRVLEKATTIQNFTVANEYNQKPCPLPGTPSPCAPYTAHSQHPPFELKKSQTFQDVTRTSEGDQKPSPETSAPAPCALCAARTAPAQKKWKKKRKKTKKSFFILNLCNEYLSRLAKLVTDFHSGNKSSGKNCIKYVFFGLLIVVWSPCLLAVILAWVVMFPWKLTNILKTDVSKRSFPINNSFKNRLRKNNLRREYQRMCFENYLPEKKRSFMTLAASFFSRTVGVVVNSFNAVVSLLKFKKNVPLEAGSSFLPSSHPNPRKRYKLFYADNRGWVLKPIRRRIRSYASNRVLRSMRCEFRPSFHQKSRGRNLEMISLKKKPCPVHETCGDLRHQFSPAGDACPMQSKGLRPSCIYNFSQPLNSHCHRRQQVNIPSTFFNPTSSIALISTDDKLIMNPINLNSNEIESKVSHKDLAKDYRSLRNNGTLPLEVVFNYSCGAKSPLITNFETRRAHKLGLSGKTFAMSTKCTSTVLPEGCQGEFRKFWSKNNVGNDLLKAPGVHKTTSSRYNTNSMPSCKLNRLRLRGQTTKVLNFPYAGNQKLAITNKSSRILQKNINFCNKSVLTDTLSQSTLSKQANTGTYKVSYAHKTQNTSMHTLYQKVRSKYKTAKTKPKKSSKCVCDIKRLPSKTKNDVIPQKYPSPATIKSSIKHNIILNRISFENRQKQSNQSYKHKPDLIPVATQMLLNTADITTITNRDVILNCSCENKCAEFKHCHKHKPHEISIATQKQLCTDDTTSTNRDLAFNCPYKENHGLSKQGYKRKPSEIPVATQIQSTKADITTSTNHKVALNCPSKETHGLSEHDYKLKPNKIPVATQILSRIADITTSTHRNVALNCACEEKNKLPKYSYKQKPQHILVATQMQSRTADITTSTHRNVALNCPCEEKNKLPKYSYTHKPQHTLVATQMQSRTADITTSTHRNVALNCPCEEKNKLPKYSYTHKPQHTLVATQMQSRTADITTSTHRNVALNCPCEEKNKLPKYSYTHKPQHILVATQMQSRTADITTSTHRNVALNCPCEEKNKLPKYSYTQKPQHILVATQMQSRTADITTSTHRNVPLNCPCEEKNKLPKYSYTHKPQHTLVATQMQSRTADITTSTHRNVALNCSCEEKNKLPKYSYTYKPQHTLVATQMQSRTADITTSTHRNVALNCPCEEKNKLPKYSYTHKPQHTLVATQMQSRTADITTSTHRNVALNCPCEEKNKLPKYSYTHKPQHTLVATQMQSRTAENATDTNRDLALNCSCEKKLRLSQHGYKHKPHNITVAIQMQSITADNATDTNRDVAWNYPGCIKPSTANKKVLCPVSTADLNLSESIYTPGQIPVVTQKQSYTVDITTNTNRGTALNYPYKHEQSEHAYKYKLDHIHAAIQKQPSSADIITSTKYLGGITPSTPNKGILHACIPSTTGKDSASIQNSAPVYLSKSQDMSIQKQSYKIDSSVNCVREDIFHPEPTLSPNKTVVYTDANTSWEKTVPQTQTASFEKVIDGVWRNKGSRKIKVLFKGIQSVALSSLQREIDTERPKRALSHKMIKYGCRTALKPTLTAEEFATERQADENVFAQYPTKEPLNLKSSFVGGTLEVRHGSTTQPLSARQLQMEEFIKQFQGQANSRLFRIASHCRYCLAPQITNLQAHSQQLKRALSCRWRETPQQNERDKELKQKVNNNKDKYTDKTSSAKEPLNKRLILSQVSSHTLQEVPKSFVIASDCVCGTKQEVVAKRSLDKDILIKRPKVYKESRWHGSGTIPLTNTQKLTSDPGTAHPPETRIVTKSLPTSIYIQEMPCDYKCECITVPPLKAKIPERLSSTQPETSKTDKTPTKFAKSPEHIPSQMLQSSSSQFRIASDWHCGKTQQNEPESKQRRDYSKNINTHKSGSAAEHPSKQSNIKEKPTRPLHEQARSLHVAFDCTCGTNQPTAAEKSSYKKVSNSKFTTAKEVKSTSTQHLPLSKALLPRQCRCKSLPQKSRCKSKSRKCRCSVESMQIFVGEQYFGSNESLISFERNIDKPRSQFPKLPERTRPSKSLPRRYRCPESPQNSEDKQPHSAKSSTLAFKRNVGKVDKTLPTLQKSSEHAKTPPQKYFHHDCTGIVKSLQGSESKKTPERRQKSFFRRRCKRNSTDILNDCPCTSSQKYLDKISFISDVPINWPTEKRSLIWSSGRTQNTCSVNEPSSQLQSSRISQYSSKVSSLVMNLRSKLFSRKSKQTKISNQPTKKPPSVIFSSRQVTPKKVDKRNISINDILESILDAESNQSFFRRTHKKKTSQNPSLPLPLHSNHSSKSSVIRNSPLRQCTKKNRYIRKATTVDKSYACLNNKARNFQRPSFIPDTSRYECRSHSTDVDTRVSQSIISQRSKISKHSSIVTLFKRKPRSKSLSAPIKSSQKFDPKYSLINCQQTPTVEQAMVQDFLSGPNTLKSKRSFSLNQFELKPLVEVIRSISDKISANSHKKNQVNKSSASTNKVKKQFDVIPQQHEVEQGIPIIPGKCRCSREQKLTKEHLLHNKQFETIPQQLKAKKVKSIVSGRYICVGNQNNTGEIFFNKKLQFNTASRNVIRPKNNISSQHLANQELKSPVVKLTQLHSCQQTGITFSTPLYNSQPICSKPCKRRKLSHGNELEGPNSLHKVAKKRILHQSTNKFQKSHLISHMCSCSATTKRLREHIIVQKSRSAGIQPNLQFQIYQDNIPDQKRFIQSPKNVDKLPRKSLQQQADAPGYAQKSTAQAEGEVRQPYPDFKRVSMRYPVLNKTSLQQSLQIPGINSPPPTNNYSPAPGATPPPNYASDPRYSIPPCVPKSPYDECDLRRAYKCRPLRYTPPRQKLRSGIMIRKLKENKQRCAEAKRRKGKQQKQSFFQCLRGLVNKTEREVWPTDVKCHPMWLNAMTTKPCYCVYKVCPRMYKPFLNCCKCSRYIGRMFVYFFTLCFWSPFLFCAYLCCNVLCKCCA